MKRLLIVLLSVICLLGTTNLDAKTTGKTPQVSGQKKPQPSAPPKAVSGITEETFRFGRFGDVTLYRQSPMPAHVVLFISGDGGWNLGVVDMARELTSLDALVVGMNITYYLKQLAVADEKCSYPAADFEALSKFVQKKLNFTQYISPVIVGYSSGATLAYATLVQAPTGTFKGAMSMGFCPDLPLTKPFCKGNGLEFEPGPKGKGYSFLPAPKLQTPWIAFQGTVDQVCDATSVQNYVKQVGGAELVLLPQVGHGFSVPKNWMPQFKEAFIKLFQQPTTTTAPAAPAVKDLPLVEVPAQGGNADLLAILVTGDGGWAGIDRDLAHTLAGKGIPVVGWDSLRYFWTRRTPDETGKDLDRILRHYLTTWKKSSAILIGYSLGADVLPFMANRLPADLVSKVKTVALLGVEPSVEFEFHLTDWVGRAASKTALPVQPEIEKLTGTTTLCLYGEEEKDSLCTKLKLPHVTLVPLKGGHHFDGNYQGIAEMILKEAK
jgi:type IV secretory pathway VirJ component